MPFPTLDRAHPAFRSGGFLYEPTGYPEGTLCQNAYIHGRSGLYISYWCIGALWQAGLRREADQRAERILEVAARLPSLYEYYDPLTGQSAGHADFGWAAAAVLLLASRAYRRGPLSL